MKGELCSRSWPKQLPVQNRPESCPQIIKLASASLWGAAGKMQGESCKAFALRETFCTLHKQPQLPSESEFPKGIISGLSCGSLSRPLLQGRPGRGFLPRSRDDRGVLPGPLPEPSFRQAPSPLLPVAAVTAKEESKGLLGLPSALSTLKWKKITLNKRIEVLCGVRLSGRAHA